MRAHPFFSLPGCIAALIFSVVVIGVTVGLGGVLFSPGQLSAQGLDKPPLQNYQSHAEFEGHCDLCHAPWQGVTPELCETCHTAVTQERQTATGVHGVLKNTNRCQLCHSEHEGRAADQTHAAMHTFPHEQTGYSLVAHQAWPDGKAFACRDCHTATSAGYRYDPAECEVCHRQVDAAFVAEHATKYSADCLACHHDLKPFDHRTFALIEKHANVACERCHANGDFAQTRSDCVACHADPEIHAGLFGTDCAACHTIKGWLPARLAKHTFPLDHGDEGEIQCTTCHVKVYTEYTCYNCHAHDAEEDQRTHLEAGITDFADCMECHADGHTKEQ